MKKRVKWIKSVSWCLILIMLAAALAACTTAEFEQLNKLEEQLRASASLGETTGAPSVETETSSETPTYIVCPPSGIHDALHFDRSVNILAWEEAKESYWCEKDQKEINVERALYNRNVTVEERLGIEIVWNFQPGYAANREPFIEEMDRACSTKPYDAVICYNLLPYCMTVKGLTANLEGTDYIDLTAPWWPESLVEETLVNGKIYSLTEASDIGLLRNMTAIFFNNELLEKKGMESPYELVERNAWDIDKLSEMIKDTYVDLNANGSVDAEDLYGFANASIAKSDAWFYALGYRESDVQDGKLHSLLDGDGFTKYIEKMIGFYDIEDVYPYDVAQPKMFREQRAYFYSGSVQYAELLLEDMQNGLNYGIVPMPKLNAKQSRYYTYLNNYYNAWCVPFNVKDMDCSSAVLEVMAVESYRQIAPVYFETYVKLRYAPDERLACMYDLIRESVVFDLGRSYSAILSGSQTPRFLMRNCISKPESYTWNTQYLTNKGVWSNWFDQILAIYH